MPQCLLVISQQELRNLQREIHKPKKMKNGNDSLFVRVNYVKSDDYPLGK